MNMKWAKFARALASASGFGSAAMVVAANMAMPLTAAVTIGGLVFTASLSAMIDLNAAKV